MKKIKNKVKFLTILILIIFMITSSQILNASPKGNDQEFQPKVQKVRVIVLKADIRLRPDKESMSLSQMTGGAILESSGKIGEWYKISLPPDEDGFIVSGYIHQSNVKIYDKEEETPEKKEKMKEDIVSKEAKEAVHEEKREDKSEKEKRIPVQERQPPRRGRDRYQRQPVKRRSSGYLYMKGIFGFGIGFEKIFTGYYETSSYDRDLDEVNVYPGGGLNIEGIIGYNISPPLSMEIGIGFQSSGEYAGGDSIYFSRVPLTFSVIYEPRSTGSSQLYIGAGGGVYLSPLYKEDMDRYEVKIHYATAYGMHFFVGMIFNRKRNIFYFGEIRFAGLMNYNWTSATVNGSSGIPAEDFASFTANGILLNLGIGFNFSK